MFVELFLQSGSWSWFILTIELILLPFGLTLLILNKTRKMIIFFIFLSFLPLLVGTIGTVIGYQQIQDAISHNANNLSKEIIFKSRETARAPLILGFWFSLPLTIIGLISLTINYYKFKGTEQMSKNVKFSLFLKRIGAFIVDNVIVFFIFFILSLILSIIGLRVNHPEGASIVLFIYFVIFVIMWLYYSLLESSSKQATFGKLMFGLIVTDLNKNRVNFVKSSLRFWAKIISNIIFGIGYLMPLFTERNQALHDMIAKCLVLNKNEIANNINTEFATPPKGQAGA